MQEFQRQKARPARRSVFWIAVATLALLAVTVASYPATKGWTVWPVSLYVSEDGVITDENGRAIGLSIDHEDGSSTSVISDDGVYIELHNDQSVKGRTLELDIGEPDTEPAGQSRGDQRQSDTNTADPQ